MTNFEYHEQEIKDFLLEHGNANFAVKNDKIIPCGKDCDLCENNIRSCCNRRKWLSDEHRQHYSIPFNTPVDTKVLVSNDGEEWVKRYFSHFRKSKYEIKPYICFESGTTSWTVSGFSDWRYCKLWEGDENESEKV